MALMLCIRLRILNFRQFLLQCRLFWLIYRLLLDHKLVSAYNDYVTNLAVNLGNSLTSMASNLLGGLGKTVGSLAGGLITGAIQV